jgi:hypothetical protein
MMEVEGLDGMLGVYFLVPRDFGATHRPLHTLHTLHTLH